MRPGPPPPFSFDVVLGKIQLAPDAGTLKKGSSSSHLGASPEPSLMA